jgi:hypothetical protein
MATPLCFRLLLSKIFRRLNRDLAATSLAHVSVVRRSIFALFVVGPASLGACSVDSVPLQLASPDAERFAAEAYPVLLRDCGFPACHGATDRFFSIYGPGRTRLAPDADPSEPASTEEITHSYDRARSMIDAEAAARSLLLRKPLASSAGGAGHKGTDSLGRNVYASTADPNFQVLRAWVFGQGGPAAVAGP